MPADHVCTFQISKDGSHNVGATSIHDIGATGQFCQAAIRRRVGSARQVVLTCAVTSPYKRDVLALAVEVSREAG
jgi:hypothetical protein